MAVAIVVYFVTDEHFLVEIVAVMIGIVIALQIEVLARIERRTQAEDRHARIVAAMESVPWLAEVLEDLARATRRVASNAELKPLVSVAKKELDKTRDCLASMRHGQFRADDADSALLFDETERAENTMLATFLQRFDLEWWSSELGKQYWEANRRAVARGVRIQRIFIYDDWTPELDEIVHRQSDAGVEVLVVSRDLVPKDCRFAIVIWDDRLIYQGELNSDGETINVLYSVSQADVEAKLNQFNRIRRFAKNASEATAQGPAAS